MPRRKGSTRPPAAAAGATEAVVAWFTHRCGKKWRGGNAAHCGACHETFGSVGAFDRHRKDGKCLTPRRIGMEIRTRGESDETQYDIWVFPMDPEVAEELRKHEQLAAF